MCVFSFVTLIMNIYIFLIRELNNKFIFAWQSHQGYSSELDSLLTPGKLIHSIVNLFKNKNKLATDVIHIVLNEEVSYFWFIPDDFHKQTFPFFKKLA